MFHDTNLDVCFTICFCITYISPEVDEYRVTKMKHSTTGLEIHIRPVPKKRCEQTRTKPHPLDMSPCRPVVGHVALSGQCDMSMSDVLRHVRQM